MFSALQDNGGFEQGVMLGLKGNQWAFALAARSGAAGRAVLRLGLWATLRRARGRAATGEAGAGVAAQQSL